MHTGTCGVDDLEVGRAADGASVAESNQSNSS